MLTCKMETDSKSLFQREKAEQGLEAGESELVPPGDQLPENGVFQKQSELKREDPSLSPPVFEHFEISCEAGRGLLEPAQESSSTPPATAPAGANSQVVGVSTSSGLSRYPTTGWLALYDANSGYPYYYHPETGTSEWILPEGCSVNGPSNALQHQQGDESHASSQRGQQWQNLPSGWHEATDNDGNTYFFNEFTEEWSWEIPAANGAGTAGVSLYDVDLSAAAASSYAGRGSRRSRSHKSKSREHQHQRYLRGFYGASESHSSSCCSSDSESSNFDTDSVTSSRSSGSSLGEDGAAALSDFRKVETADSSSGHFTDPEDGRKAVRKMRKEEKRRRRRKRRMSLAEVVHDSFLVASLRASTALRSLRPKANALAEGTVAVGKSMYEAGSQLASRAVRYLTGSHTNASAQAIFHGPRSVGPGCLEGQTHSQKRSPCPLNSEHSTGLYRAREIEVSVPGRISHLQRQGGLPIPVPRPTHGGRKIFYRVMDGSAGGRTPANAVSASQSETESLSPIECRELRKSLSVSGGHWPGAGNMLGPQDAPPVSERLNLCSAEEDAIKEMIAANGKLQAASTERALNEMSKMLL